MIPAENASTVRVGPALVVSRLAADPFILLQVLTFGAVAAIYLLPIVPPATREWFANQWLCAPFLVLPVVASLIGLRAIRDTAESKMWRAVGLGLTCWLAALLLYGIVEEARWTPAWDLALDVLYFGYGLSLLVAIEFRPSGADGDADASLERRLRVAGVATLATGWTAYAVFVPLMVAGSAERSMPSDVAYVAIDALIAVRLSALWRQADTQRWRWVYGGLAAAAGALLVTDALNSLIDTDLLEWHAGHAAELLWGVPGTLFLVAIRLRQCPFSTEDERHSPAHADPDLRPVRVGTHLILGALSFPVVHALLVDSRVLPPGHELLIRAERVVAVTSTLTLSTLAIVAYRMLERRRVAMLHERRALETKLVQAQKMEAVGRLAGGVAHDFNNLLTVIGGYTNMVVDSLAAADPNRPMLEEVQKATTRAADLTRQLLAFSRRQLLQTERVDLNGVVTGMERMLRRLIGEDVRMETHLAHDLVPVMADAGQLGQVLLNLAVNSRDAMPGGGTLTITTANAGSGTPADQPAPTGAPARWVECRVRDSGVGIPDDVLPFIFEPFFTTKDKDKGTGLGLATVYGIVTQSGGTISVTSGVGQGTEFLIRLPGVEADQTEPRVLDTAALPPERGEATILLVEDERAVRELASRMLGHAGYTVMEAAGGEEALAISAHHVGRIDLLLTDLVMPGMSGRVLAERLTRVRPATKVLYMTGYTEDTVLRHGLQEGTVDLIQKPFSQPGLLARVRTLLEGAPAMAAGRPGEGGVPAVRPS